MKIRYIYAYNVFFLRHNWKQNCVAVRKWIELEIIMLSKIRPTEKGQSFMLSFICRAYSLGGGRSSGRRLTTEEWSSEEGCGTGRAKNKREVFWNDMISTYKLIF